MKYKIGNLGYDMRPFIEHQDLTQDAFQVLLIFLKRNFSEKMLLTIRPNNLLATAMTQNISSDFISSFPPKVKIEVDENSNKI